MFSKGRLDVGYKAADSIRPRQVAGAPTGTSRSNLRLTASIRRWRLQLIGSGLDPNLYLNPSFERETNGPISRV